MKKIIILMAIMFLMLLIFVDLLMALERPTGFRGLIWGAEFSTVASEMVYLRTEPDWGGVDIYCRKNDAMVIGDATVDRIEYAFWGGKFFNIAIYFSNYANFASLKDVLFERFGKGLQANRYIKEYAWDFAEALVAIKYSDISKRGSILMFSNEMMIKVKQYQKEKANEGAKRGF